MSCHHPHVYACDVDDSEVIAVVLEKYASVYNQGMIQSRAWHLIASHDATHAHAHTHDSHITCMYSVLDGSPYRLREVNFQKVTHVLAPEKRLAGEQHSTAQHITSQHITAQHITAHHIIFTAQHSTAHHSTAPQAVAATPHQVWTYFQALTCDMCAAIRVCLIDYHSTYSMYGKKRLSSQCVLLYTMSCSYDNACAASMSCMYNDAMTSHAQ